VSYSAIVMISSLVEDVKNEYLLALSFQLSALSIGGLAENTTVSV
jgi:hypothetical protein